MKTTHKQKVKIARKLIGNKKMWLFNNPLWNARALSIQKTVTKKIAAAKARIAAKKEAIA